MPSLDLSTAHDGDHVFVEELNQAQQAAVIVLILEKLNVHIIVRSYGNSDENYLALEPNNV